MRSFSNTLALIIAVVLAVGLGVATFFVSKTVLSAGDVELNTVLLDRTSFIYAKDSNTGESVEYDRLYDEENRIWVEYEKIPKDMVNAFVAIEDERFYSHHGFDVKRLLGAATTFMSKGNSSYGASTITQQLVKNLSGDDELSIKRKIQEIYRAVRIEQKYTKEEIIEFYLNTIFLSRQCNGVQAASQRYFGKNVWDLSLAQMTSIAGITQYPSKYDPISNPENNKEKQLLVLSKMKELGFISEQEYDTAAAEKLVFNADDIAQQLPRTQKQFADAVINEVLEDLQSELGYPKQIAMKMLYTGGLTINASVDLEIQKIIEDVYNDSSNFPYSSGAELLQSSMVIIDPQTGYVVGMSGGRGASAARMDLNRATQSLRQPGSSIKPIAVYVPAMEYGIIEPYTTVVDEPLTIGNWSPKNSNNKFSGSVTVKNAITYSRNIPAIKVLQSLSIDSSFDFLKNKLGVSSLVEEREIDGKTFSDKTLPSLALGGLTDGVSVLNMAGAYEPLANGGIYRKPTTYINVLDSNGNVLLNGSDTGERVIMPDTAYKMTDMLENVVEEGTGTGAYLSNSPVAGKTGTTDEDKDRWFVGYTPYYVGAVWFGYDTPKPLSSVGQNPSVTIWKKIMSKIHSNLTKKNFEKPVDNNNIVKICKVSGKVATDLCALDIRGSQIEYVDFTGKKIPTEKCTLHKEYSLCYSTGLRARSGCPKRKVSALGVADDTHTEKDGYITDKYCTQYHTSTFTRSYDDSRERSSSYTICLDSGLLAGSGCTHTKKIYDGEGKKPTSKCTQHSGTSSGTASSTASPDKKTGSGLSTPVPEKVTGAAPQASSKPQANTENKTDTHSAVE